MASGNYFLDTYGPGAPLSGEPPQPAPAQAAQAPAPPATAGAPPPMPKPTDEIMQPATPKTGNYYLDTYGEGEKPPPGPPPPEGPKPHEYAFLKGFVGQSNRVLALLERAATKSATGLAMAEDPEHAQEAQDAQDIWYKNLVEPTVQHQAMFELPPDAGFVDKAFHGLGSTAAMIAEAIASGGAAAGATTEALGGGIAARAAGGAVSMQLPAAANAVDVGHQVLAETGDQKAAMTAGVTSYLINSAMGAVPMGVGGRLATRVATAGGAGAALQEAGRVAQNAAMPADMQQPFDPKEDALAALTTAPFGLLPHGLPAARRPVVEAAPANAMEAAQVHAAEAVRAEGGDGLDQVVAAAQVNAHVGAVHDAAAVQGAREAAVRARAQQELAERQAEDEFQPLQETPGAATTEEAGGAGAEKGGGAEPAPTLAEALPPDQLAALQGLKARRAAEAAKPAEAPTEAKAPAEEEEAPETNPPPVKPADLAARRQAALDEAMAAKVRKAPAASEEAPTEAPASEKAPEAVTKPSAVAPVNRLAMIRAAAEKRQQPAQYTAVNRDTGEKVADLADFAAAREHRERFPNDDIVPAEQAPRFNAPAPEDRARSNGPRTAADRVEFLQDEISATEPGSADYESLRQELAALGAKPEARPPPQEKVPLGTLLQRKLANNASGESAASLEAINRGSRNLDLVKPDGSSEPVMGGVDQVDRQAPPGHLIVDRDTGETVSRGKDLNNLQANGLKNRYLAQRPKFATPAEDAAANLRRDIGDQLRLSPDEAQRHLKAFSDAGHEFQVHDSPADAAAKMPDGAMKRALAQHPNAKGAFDPETNQVHIFAGAHDDPEELRRTMVHELAHKGVRSFLGDDYHQTMDQIARHGDAKTQRWMQDYMGARKLDPKNPRHRWLAADEYAAHLAETPAENPGVFRRIADSVRSGLRKLGLVREWNDNDIRHLLRASDNQLNSEAAARGRIEKGIRFSEPSDSDQYEKYGPEHPLAQAAKHGETMEKQAKYNPGFVRSIGDAINDFKDSAPRKILGAIGLRNLPDFMSRDKMPSLHRFIDEHDAMEGRKGQLHTRDNALAADWSRWQAKQPDRGEALSDLMHASTLSGHDPSKPYEERYTAEERKADPEKAKDETYQRAMHRSLRESYNKLDPKGQELYNRVRDNYQQKRVQVFDALNKRIQETGADEETKKNLMAQLRKQWESGSVKGPYFPLQRFGDLWANAKDEAGNTHAFARFESAAQQKAWKAEMTKQGFKVDSGRRMDTNSMMERIDPDFVKNVMGLAHEADPSGALEKEIWEQYLKAMPEMSMRKHMITRVGRLGFSGDALRAFAYNSFHGAHQLARLEYGSRLEERISGAEQEARALEQHGAANPDDRVAQSDARWAPQLVQELRDRYEWIKNPRAAAWASNATKFGFTWYLGAAPATAFRIFSQNPMLAAPMLAKHFGWLGASRELSRATAQWAKSYGSLGDTLRGDERRAFDEANDRGVFSNTNTQMLASGGEGAPIQQGPYYQFQRAAGFLFNAMEHHNRMTTLLAAYRLARMQGQGHADASRQARQLTWDSHFDYTNANRPRYLQNNTAKVIGLFKQYSLGVTYRLAREFRDMTARDTDPESRKAAAVAFGGLIGRMMMFAGVTGIPFYWAAEAAVNAVMGSQDQPYDMTAALHKHLNDALGTTAGDAIMTGPVGAMSGASLSGGASYGDLWYRPPSREETASEQMLDGVGQLLGPIAAIPLNAATGVDMMHKGNVERGLEHFLPPEAAALSKAVRYSTEGANNLSGEPVVPKDQIDSRDIFLQSMGFTPQKIADAYARNTAIKNIDREIVQRRQLLSNQYETAALNGDTKEMTRIGGQIESFNEANPGMPIGKNVYQGMMGKAKKAAGAIAGVNVAKGNEHLEEEY